MAKQGSTSKKGRFITFEGGEGTGKSTQISLIAERLLQHGIEIVETREPGGTIEGEAIRTLLKDPVYNWTSFSETLLNSAARAEHVERLIAPSLAQGVWVVCDRFYDSTTAYQGIVGEADLALIETLNAQSVGTTKPDLTILLDLDPGIAADRLQERTQKPDRYDGKEMAFHVALRAAYLSLAKKEPNRFFVVNSGRERNIVTNEIWAEMEKRFLG